MLLAGLQPPCRWLHWPGNCSDSQNHAAAGMSRHSKFIICRPRRIEDCTSRPSKFANKLLGRHVHEQPPERSAYRSRHRLERAVSFLDFIIGQELLRHSMVNDGTMIHDI